MNEILARRLWRICEREDSGRDRKGENLKLHSVSERGAQALLFISPEGGNRGSHRV